MPSSTRWRKFTRFSPACFYINRAAIVQSTGKHHVDKNRTEGAKKEIKGGTKEVIGKVTGNKSKEVAGKVEKNVGKVQRNVGEASDEAKKGSKR